MKVLCFGMPGTGKSTFVKSKPLTQQLRLDLGHNAFRNEEQRQKFYKKAVTHTTFELRVIAPLSWYYDTYAEYFDPREVAKYDIHVVFAIPSEQQLVDLVIPRVYRRDGASEFVSDYTNQGLKWREGFIKEYQRWKTILGKAKVTLIDLYDNYHA